MKVRSQSPLQKSISLFECDLVKLKSLYNEIAKEDPYRIEVIKKDYKNLHHAIAERLGLPVEVLDKLLQNLNITIEQMVCFSEEAYLAHFKESEISIKNSIFLYLVKFDLVPLLSQNPYSDTVKATIDNLSTKNNQESIGTKTEKEKNNLDTVSVQHKGVKRSYPSSQTNSQKSKKKKKRHTKKRKKIIPLKERKFTKREDGYYYYFPKDTSYKSLRNNSSTFYSYANRRRKLGISITIDSEKRAIKLSEDDYLKLQHQFDINSKNSAGGGVFEEIKQSKTDEEKKVLEHKDLNKKRTLVSKQSHSSKKQKIESSAANDSNANNESTPSNLNADEIETGLIKKIEKAWKAFFKDIKRFIRQKDDADLTAKVKKRYELANQLSPLAMPIMALEIIKENPALLEEQGKYKVKKHEIYPFTYAVARGENWFEKPIIRGGIPLRYFGIFSSFSLTTKPSGDYTIARSVHFASKENRLVFLKKYYLPFAYTESDEKAVLAAKALLILFSHIVKELKMIDTENLALLRTFINHELRKAHLPIMPSLIMKHLNKLFNKMDFDFKAKKLQKYFQFDSKNKVPIRQPKYEKESISATEDPIKVLWVEKKNTYSKNEKIDSVPADFHIINYECDVYDKDTGEFIASFRKKVLASSVIDSVNQHAFNIQPGILHKRGAHSAGDKKNHSQSVPLGIFGFKKSGIKLTRFLTDFKYTPELIKAFSEALNVLESLYQSVAPEEFEYCSKLLANIASYIVFPEAKTTTVVEMNYDKQTTTHRDENAFVGKNIGMLTCFFGSAEKRYEGGCTLFPEYKIGFDVEQGDALVANFEILHCNTKIIPKPHDESAESKSGFSRYSRLSTVFFTRGEIFGQAERMAFETSDDEVDIDETKDESFSQNSGTFMGLLTLAKNSPGSK